MAVGGYKGLLVYAPPRTGKTVLLQNMAKAITDNQVIRHRLVDMMVAIEQSRAITEAAAHGLDSDARGRRRAVSLAKAFVSGAGRRVGEDAVQLHGAIGMTDEYEVGQCYKRLAAAANLFPHLVPHGNPWSDLLVPLAAEGRMTWSLVPWAGGIAPWALALVVAISRGTV